jgi:hypothetical protein
VVTVDSASAFGGGAFSADLFSGFMTETGKVDGSGGGGGGAGGAATVAAAVLELSAAPFAAFAPLAPPAPATTAFGTALFAAEFALPDWPWFATGATCASVGSCCALLLPTVGSTPADVRPAPAHADGMREQQAASSRIRELIIGLW